MLIVSVFQSTLPTRGETYMRHNPRATPAISIHSPHTGRDLTCARVMDFGINFNPLSPYGERRKTPDQLRRMAEFQSPLPIRGETSRFQCRFLAEQFQSPLPIRGETYPQKLSGRPQKYFNPLSPYGERPTHLLLSASRAKFQSPLPIRGETKTAGVSANEYIFQSPLPIRGETADGGI